MKRLIIAILIVFNFISAGFAYEPEILNFTAVIPEDYGVVFPEEAVHLDKLYLGVSSGYGEGLIKDPYITLVAPGGTTCEYAIDFLYYGNNGESYDVSLEASSPGLISAEDSSYESIPVAIRFVDMNGDDGIVSKEKPNEIVEITVPPAGARKGDLVTTMVLSWELPLDILPGEYYSEINLELKDRG